MQDAVEDRRQHETGGDDDNQAGEERIETGKNLAAGGFQLTHWTHAGQNHRRVDECIDERHALEKRIAGNTDGHAGRGQEQPQADRDAHADEEFPPRRHRLAAPLEPGKTGSSCRHVRSSLACRADGS
jgi:hypothetical protein